MDNDKKTLEQEVFERVNTLSTQFFEDMFKPLEKLHIDLECLMDFDLGILLSMIDTQEQYDYLLKNIPAYEQRKTREVCKYFPELGLDDEEIEEFKNTPENLDLLSVGSPKTNIFAVLPELVSQWKIYNHHCPQTVQSRRICLNVPSFGFSERGKELLRRKFSLFTDTVSMEFVDIDFNTTSKDYYKSVNMFILYNMKEFSQAGMSAGLFIKDGLFLDKTIYAFPFIDPDRLKSKTISEQELLKNTETLLNVFCDFKFVEPEIVIQGG